MCYASHWNHDILSKIRMKYVSTAKELIALMAGIQFLVPLPTSIIIDDFSSIIGPRSDDLNHLDQFIITLAYVSDAVSYLQEANPSNNSFYLILTDNFFPPQHRSIILKTLQTSLELHRHTVSNTTTISLRNENVLQHSQQQQQLALVRYQQGRLIASS